MTHLFSSLQIKNTTIKNRIVMPPMVCFGWADDNGLTTEQHLQHYEARAKGGTGLIILEAHCVAKSGRLANSQLGIWSDDHIEGLRKLAQVCHRHGAVVLVQIHHSGLQTSSEVVETAMGPSEKIDKDRKSAAMTPEEIHNIQQNFIDAALRAEKAGLDGIELHGAHGYLIDQFMSPITNHRTDLYGGVLTNRARFAKEIICGIRKATQDSFILGYRMGGNEPDLEDGIQIARLLEAEGVDLLHVSKGIESSSLPSIPEDFPYNWVVYYGTEIKKQVHIPVIVVNDIRTPERAAYLIEQELADFVAIGRGLLVDSAWAQKAQQMEQVNSCLDCKRCNWFMDGSKCPQNRK